MIQHTLRSNGQAEKMTQKLGSICKSKLEDLSLTLPRSALTPRVSSTRRTLSTLFSLCSSRAQRAPAPLYAMHCCSFWRTRMSQVSRVGDGRWWSTAMLEWVLGVSEAWLIWKIKHLPSLDTITCSWQWWMELDIWGRGGVVRDIARIKQWFLILLETMLQLKQICKTIFLSFNGVSNGLEGTFCPLKVCCNLPKNIRTIVLD